MNINGLSYYNDFITDEEEDTIINKIYLNKWNNSLSRRVQQYGHAYLYNHVKNINTNVEPIPNWILKIYKNMVKKNIAPNINIEKLQVIINEYKIGQGIGKHIDDPNKFTDWIISLSLNSGCEIEFKHYNNIKKIYVDRCSVYKMEKDSRYIWTHEIKPKLFDKINNNETIKREIRISITFREIK